MIDTRFHNIAGPYKISEIAAQIGAEVSNISADISISAISPLEEAEPSHLSFLSNKKYFDEFKTTKASACIVSEDISQEVRGDIILLRAKNPYFAYTKAIDLFYRSAKTYPAKITPSAIVASSAKIGKNCYIGHNTVIEDNVVIGDDCIIEAGCFIDYGVVIGAGAKIYSSVSISCSIIGDNVVILPGARICQDCFGFSTEKGIHHKIYHTGRVIIGNNVEIGANTTIDRGSMNDTVIEDLARLDNLVQLGHNVAIGKGSIIVAQVGIAGSSKVGAYCALGGQVGIAGHIKIGDKAQIVAQSGVMKDIENGAIVAGTPTVAVRDWHKQSIIMKKLLNENK